MLLAWAISTAIPPLAAAAVVAAAAVAAAHEADPVIHAAMSAQTFGYIIVQLANYHHIALCLLLRHLERPLSIVSRVLLLDLASQQPTSTDHQQRGSGPADTPTTSHLFL
jgi:hypothetical protein